MRDWFYTKAKSLKQAAFFVSGAAVALSTATAISSATASWISNLIAIVGCSVYSSFDNIETAHSITVREEKIQQLVKKISLEDFQGDDHSILLRDILENISSLEIKTEDLTVAIDQTAEELKESLAQKYARTNWIAQMITSIVTGAINIWANVEEDTENRDNLFTPKNILNLTLVPVCMLVWQCWWHYRTAKNLQEMAEKTENLERTLSQASKSLVFRTKECRLFWQRKEKVEVELRECEQRINILNDEMRKHKIENHAIGEEIKQCMTEIEVEQLRVRKIALEAIIQHDEQELKVLEESSSGLHAE